MKRYILFLLISILCLSGCKESKEEAPRIFTPADILSAEDIKDYINFEPVCEESQTDEAKIIKYKNSTPGSSDIVEVKVFIENDFISNSQIEEKFNFYKNKNKEFESLIPIDGMDAECFIAIPSSYILKDGYMVVISAGSGGEDAQINLLRSLTEIAIKNMNE